jgi:hypothetical protein
MHTVGMIIGHGYAKAVCNDRSTRFPAVAAPARDAGYESTIGRGPSAINLNGHGDWLVGTEALTFAPQRLVSILDRTRYSDPSFVALARHALHQVAMGPDALTIMTGMPGAWYADKNARSALETAIRTAAAPWGPSTVRVAPEAAGIFYRYVFEAGTLNKDRTRGQTGIIDIGYRDMNVALFHDGRYVAGESVPGGMVDALRQIKRLVADAYGLELAPHEIDSAIQAGGIRVSGELRPLPHGSQAALEAGLSTLLATARSLWPNGGKTLDAIVLGGGGAIALGPAILTTFPQAVVPGADLHNVPPTAIGATIASADPQLMGAQGFAAAAAAAGAR